MRTKICRICQSENLQVIIDYGKVALADSFLSNDKEIDNEQKYDLRLCICNICKHVQIDEIIDPKLMFTDYPWETGISKSIIQYADEMSKKIIKCFTAISPKVKPRVFEIASNDGTLLNVFKSKKCEVLGVDPAKNIAKKANDRSINTIPNFFNHKIAKSIISDYGQWDICIARNVLAHVMELHSLVKGIKTILNENGFAVIEVPHLQTMFQDLQYDQVFHEHIGYHSLDSIKRLFGMYNMEIFDVESIWIHGGSLRVFLQHLGGSRKINDNVEKLLKEESQIGLFDEKMWEDYATRVHLHKESLMEELIRIKNSHRRLAIYGASGKGQSLLQFCGIDNNLIDYVVDKSPLKQGKITPGTHIRIFEPAYIYRELPDVILLCAWNFADEIVRQEKKFIDLGNKFLLPFPYPHYYNTNN